MHSYFFSFPDLVVYPFFSLSVLAIFGGWYFFSLSPRYYQLKDMQEHIALYEKRVMSLHKRMSKRDELSFTTKRIEKQLSEKLKNVSSTLRQRCAQLFNDLRKSEITLIFYSKEQPKKCRTYFVQEFSIECSGSFEHLLPLLSYVIIEGTLTKREDQIVFLGTLLLYAGDI